MLLNNSNFNFTSLFSSSPLLQVEVQSRPPFLKIWDKAQPPILPPFSRKLVGFGWGAHYEFTPQLKIFNLVFYMFFEEIEEVKKTSKLRKIFFVFIMISGSYSYIFLNLLEPLVASVALCHYSNVFFDSISHHGCNIFVH